MAEVSEFSLNLISAYSQFLTIFPDYFQSFVNIFLLVLMIVIYSVLVWKFYKFIGKKNIILLNLKKYNTSEHPLIAKLFAGIFYFIENIVILPFIIFIGFAAFASFLILLSSELEIQTILFLSVTIVGAIRMMSYIPKYGENIAQEVAKIIPLTLLSVFILNPGFFDFSRIVEQIGKLPLVYTNILIYLSFIIILELILRFFDLIFAALGLHDEESEEE